MNKPLVIDPGVLERMQKLARAERLECFSALLELTQSFGRPHVHTGLGIRKLGGSLFECRANLSLRFVFQNRLEDLYVAFLGNHDDIKALLRSGKFNR